MTSATPGARIHYTVDGGEPTEDDSLADAPLDVSAPVITDALLRRLRCREEAPLADKILAVMRNQFGGHAVKKES